MGIRSGTLNLLVSGKGPGVLSWASFSGSSGGTLDWLLCWSGGECSDMWSYRAKPVPRCTQQSANCLRPSFLTPQWPLEVCWSPFGVQALSLGLLTSFSFLQCFLVSPTVLRQVSGLQSALQLGLGWRFRDSWRGSRKLGHWPWTHPAH